MITNQQAFLEIAEDALAESERLGSEQTRPKSGGEEGFVHTLDPHQRSFKQACVALIFACCYLEALLFVVGAKCYGHNKWKSKYDELIYEEKLVSLGLESCELIQEASHLRAVRKEIIHEKAVSVQSEDWGPIYIAQNEAKRAMTFVKRVRDVLSQSLPGQTECAPSP